MKYAICVLALIVIMLSLPVMAAEPDYGKAYEQAGKWLETAKGTLEGRQWKVVSNQWSVERPNYNGLIVLSYEEKGKKTELTFKYRIPSRNSEDSDKIYQWLRPNDLITLKVKALESDRMALREEIVRTNNKFEPVYLYEYSYISGVVLSPAAPAK